VIATHSLPAIAGGTPARSTFLVFGQPQIGEDEIAEVVDTLRSGWIGFGPKSLRLEREFAAYVGAQHSISASSCTAGLHLALLAAGIQPGDEVITTPLTFAATANVIEHVGARPVFADVDPLSQNIDPQWIRQAITPRTRALLPVHMAGRPCDMGSIQAIATEHGLSVIEDAAHAVEAISNGRKIGAISAFTAFSFYATKNMTTAEGGMVTTANAAAAERMRVLRLHGISEDAWRRYSAEGFSRYETLEPGYKYNLTDLQASLGLHQLARIDANLAIRERHWRHYDEDLAGLEALEIPAPVQPADRHARHLYTILLRLDRLEVTRQQFLEALRAENIGAGVHFTAVHLHAYYRQKYGYQPGSFPVAEDIGRRTVSLPLSPKLSDDDVDGVIFAIRKLVTHFGR